MENFDPASPPYLATRTILVCLTTSNTERSEYPWAVLIPDGTLDTLIGDAVIDLENNHEVNCDDFCRHDCHYIGCLPDAIMQRVDLALEYAVRTPEERILRMRRPI